MKAKSGYALAASQARRIVKREALRFADLHRNVSDAGLAHFMRLRYRQRVRQLQFALSVTNAA